MMLCRSLKRKRIYRAARRKTRRLKQSMAGDEAMRLSTRFGRHLPELRQGHSKLIAAVGRAERYCRWIARQIPGPLIFTPDRWADDPLINAICVNNRKMADEIGTHRGLARLFAEPAVDTAFAALVATRKEKVVFGIKRQGPMVQRDVRQTAVYFEDISFTAISADLNLTRRQFCHQLMDDMVHRLVQDLEEKSLRQAELNRQLQMLETMAAVQDKADAHRDDQMGAAESSSKRMMASLEQELSGAREAMKTRSDELALIIQGLGHPQSHLTAQPVFLRLSRLGIVLDHTANEPVNEFTILELTQPPAKRWTAVWVAIPRTAFHANQSSSRADT